MRPHLNTTGKQYNTDDIIKRKQNEILTVFLADILKLGQDGSGSFALSEGKNNLLALSIESIMKSISDVIDYDLVKQTLLLNGWNLSDKDMPKWHFNDIDDPDLDNLSKFVQRVMAVGGITADQELENHLRKVANFPENKYDNPIPEDFKNTKMQSRSGDGMTDGLGSGTGGASGDSGDGSAGNTENA